MISCVTGKDYADLLSVWFASTGVAIRREDMSPSYTTREPDTLSVRKTCSRAGTKGRTHVRHSHSSDPTRPDGTEVKNGVPPSSSKSWKCDDGVTKAFASAAHVHCPMRVSSLVETTTVRFSLGSISS